MGYIVLNRSVEHPCQLASHAAQLLEQLRFSFLHESGTLMEEHQIEHNLSGGTYPTECENSLLHLLHQGRSLEAYQQYQTFLALVSNGSFTHLRFSFKRLYISMQLLVKELQNVGCFTQYKELGITEFEAFIENLASKAELDRYFLTWCERFEEELQKCKAQKNQLLVDHIKGIVTEEYANPNLCLQYLADAVHLSTSYVSKLFKECESKSVNDYVQEYRMQKVVTRLEDSDVPVKDIASSAGFVNEHYFYTLFKKVYDTTPNEYRKRMRLQ